MALLALSSAHADAQAAADPPAAPLAIATEAGDAARLDAAAAAPLTAIAPFDAVAPEVPFQTAADGFLTLHFADGLRTRIGASTRARLTGTYAEAGYDARGFVLDSGLVAYTFDAGQAADSATFQMTDRAGAAVVMGGTGGVLAGTTGLRLVVLTGEAALTDPSSGARLAVPAGSAGVVGDEGLAVRPSTLAERDQVAEPVARRRRLLVPGTDDEGNARTFIIEWDD